MKFENINKAVIMFETNPYEGSDDETYFRQDYLGKCLIMTRINHLEFRSYDSVWTQGFLNRNATLVEVLDRRPSIVMSQFLNRGI